MTVHGGSHGTTVLWCTWVMPQKNISGIHNGLEGWESLKWGYGVRITMVLLMEMAVDQIFDPAKQGFEIQASRGTCCIGY